MGDAKDIVYGLLSPIDPKDAAIIYAVLGISFHLCIRKVEIDNQFWSLLAIYIAVWMQLTGAYLGIYHLPVLQAIKMSSLCGCSFMTGLTASISVYRLFFHRLRRFPGPWAAKLSRFYNARLAYKSLQYNRELEKLHKKYGDFVRTGRNQPWTCFIFIYYTDSSLPRTSRDIHHPALRRSGLFRLSIRVPQIYLVQSGHSRPKKDKSCHHPGP